MWPWIDMVRGTQLRCRSIICQSNDSCFCFLVAHPVGNHLGAQRFHQQLSNPVRNHSCEQLFLKNLYFRKQGKGILWLFLVDSLRIWIPVVKRLHDFTSGWHDCLHSCEQPFWCATIPSESVLSEALAAPDALWATIPVRSQSSIYSLLEVDPLRVWVSSLAWLMVFTCIFSSFDSHDVEVEV